MIHYIGDYIYDPDRLLLYEKSLTDKEREILFSSVPTSNQYAADIDFLSQASRRQDSMRHRTVQYAGILLNGNCGLRCTYCSQSSSENYAQNPSLQDILAFVQRILTKRVIAGLATRQEPSSTFYFTGGGEPTYDWSMFKTTILSMQELCAKSGVRLSLRLTTNGMLNAQQIDFIKNNFDSVLISYDGIPEIQNRNRPTPMHGPTSSIVENAIDQFSNSSVQTTIRSTVWHSDFGSLKDMAIYITDKFPHLSYWDINPVTPAGRAVERMQQGTNNLMSMDFVDAYMELVNFVSCIKPNLHISTPLLASEPVGFNCGGIGAKVISEWLRMDGKITTCSDTCDIYTEIGKVENGKVMYYDEFKDPLLEMGYLKYKECRDCIAFRICGSGCPLKHIREETFPTGGIEWECSMQKKYWKIILSRLITESDGEDCYGWKREKIAIPQLEYRTIYRLKYMS